MIGELWWETALSAAGCTIVSNFQLFAVSPSEQAVANDIPTFTSVRRLMKETSAEQEARGEASLCSDRLIDYENDFGHE